MTDVYDFVVLGGGSAGYAGAATAARLGLRTAVIEGGAEVGGLCILRGCMPSKALLESAHRAEQIRRASEFGLRATYHGADGSRILQRKRLLISDFAQYRRTQLETGRFDYIRGKARFTGTHHVEVLQENGGARRIQGRSFLLATGSRLNPVEIPGLAEVGVWDSDRVLDSEQIPASVVVLGGGAVALEFASYYAGLGVSVTVLQRGGHVLKEMDADVADALEQGLLKRGIRVFCGTALRRLEAVGGRKRVIFEKGGEEMSVEAEEVIYGLGRRPLVEGLNLECAGVDLEGGAVCTSKTQQTSASHIFAAGDVCGPYEMVHIAIQQGEVAARNAARLLNGARAFRGNADAPEEMDYGLKLFAVFSQPQVAMVGFTEKELVGRDVLVARYPFNDHGKSLLMGESEGFVKLICERQSRRILGGAVVGPEASELIHEVAVAMYFKATADDLMRVPHYHPTLSEIWTYPAEELAAGG
jgi:pyruvate/2-oxoglutarate dehydrogenase complex dihydrolipoamide dehydrogenase (E3) component